MRQSWSWRGFAKKLSTQRLQTPASPTQGNKGTFGARTPPPRLLHAEQFDVEHQRCVRGNDAAGTAGAVAQRGRNDQGALAADFHGGDAFVPAGDDLALPDRKLERLIAIDRTVEFLALLAVLVKPAGVMHDADLTGLWCRAGADGRVDHLQA